MSAYLFIGGVADGRRIELPNDGNICVVPIPSKLPQAGYGDQFEEWKPPESHRYCLTHGQFFKWDGITMAEAVRLLVEGYSSGAINDLHWCLGEAVEQVAKLRMEYMRLGGDPKAAPLKLIIPNVFRL